MRNHQSSRWGWLGSSWLILASLAPAGPTLPASQAPEGKADADAIRAATQAKITAGTAVLAKLRQSLVAPPAGLAGPRGIPDRICAWSSRLTDAKLEAAATHDARVKVLSEALDHAKQLEPWLKELYEAEACGLVSEDLDIAAFHRADVEVRLLREQSRPN